MSYETTSVTNAHVVTPWAALDRLIDLARSDTSLDWAAVDALEPGDALSDEAGPETTP